MRRRNEEMKSSAGARVPTGRRSAKQLAHYNIKRLALFSRRERNKIKQQHDAGDEYVRTIRRVVFTRRESSKYL